MGWIEIRGWDRFQHYKERRPVWIKLHLDLLDNPDFIALPEGTQLLLIKLWITYARTHRQLADNTATLTRQLGQRVLKLQLERLVEAGFIRILASRPLAPSYQDAIPETETDIQRSVVGPIDAGDNRNEQRLPDFDQMLKDIP